MSKIVVMPELSLYILDISYNSIEANAKNIEIVINDTTDNIDLIIIDDGLGDNSLEEKVLQTDNYSTKHRGYGLKSFIHYINEVNGTYSITSSKDEGTIIKANFPKENLIPLGDISKTIVTLIQKVQAINYLFRYYNNNKQFILDTKKIKLKLNNISIVRPEILLWINDYIEEGLHEILR